MGSAICRVCVFFPFAAFPTNSAVNRLRHGKNAQDVQPRPRLSTWRWASVASKCKANVDQLPRLAFLYDTSVPGYVVNITGRSCHITSNDDFGNTPSAKE